MRPRIAAMNKSLLSAFVATILLAAAPAAQQAQAGTGIQRCQGSDGATVYTDKSCAAFGARAVPMSGELLTKIVREQARAELATVEGDMALGGYADAETPLAAGTAAVGRRSLSGGCARTPTQLAMDLRGAFALQDVNRIAESYDWVGMSSKGANRIMERLESLARHTIADTQYFDAQITSGDALMASDDTSGGSGGVMQVTFGAGSTLFVTDFDVQREAGCYFVRF
jgi:hypothetical protein